VGKRRGYFMYFFVSTDQAGQGHSFIANGYLKYRSNGFSLVYFLLLLYVINLDLFFGDSACSY
jgi:hypothetical protein